MKESVVKSVVTYQPATEEERGNNLFMGAAPQCPREFYALRLLVRNQRPKTILEVGSRYGHSFYRFCMDNEQTLERAISIDLPGGSWGKSDSRDSLQALVDIYDFAEVHFIDAGGPEAKALAKELAGSVDFVFLDADHGLDATFRDFERFWPCVAKGGFLAMHDIVGLAPVEVPEVWQTVRNRGSWLELVGGPTFGTGLLWKT